MFPIFGVRKAKPPKRISVRHQDLSLPSYAFRLRKQLLQGQPLDKLVEIHKDHQSMLAHFEARHKPHLLAHHEKFALKFLRELNCLRPDFNGRRVHQEGRGVFHDLNAILAQVQAIWFPDMAHPPKAKWLSSFSTRKLAHYNLRADEIAFSLVFDSLDVPSEVLNYLAYHELLHRKLGIKVVGGKRFAHTPEFKAMERRFPHHEEAEAKISRYLRSL